MNFELIIWFFEIPCLSDKSSNCVKICFTNPLTARTVVLQILTIPLVPVFGWKICLPTCPWRTRPIIHLVLRSVTGALLNSPASLPNVGLNKDRLFVVIHQIGHQIYFFCRDKSLSFRPLFFFVVAQFRNDTGLPVSNVSCTIWFSIRTIALSHFVGYILGL